ncbi:biotin--protein ligase isoform X2 [Scleropages formosus]|uniref:biotin--protein ligase isoform X2 n=1 Tax=Scleropages formosus TaxID=113540 RepID=UPI0010FACDC0|nr:biotin--protein ligase isoform X2 [Scleropages formosus]
MLTQLGGRSSFPACDFSKWTVPLGSSLLATPKTENSENIAFLIEATSEQGVAIKHYTSSNNKTLRWSDYCLPLALSPGQPFRAVAEASIDNFSHLGVAFMEDRLHLDNGLIPEKIVSVLLRESAFEELVENQKLDLNKQKDLLLNSATEETPLSQHIPYERRKVPEVGETNGAEQACDELQIAPELEIQESNPGDQEVSEKSGAVTDHHTEDYHMEGRHLHLSSCHECLELENSTILSVKFASAEDIPDLPDDYESGRDGVEEEWGEEESFVLRTKRANPGGKPPNVLVYTGGCERRFDRVHALLAECVDTDSYTVYHLRPPKALSEPWLNSALLLVLASDEPLAPQLCDRILAYLRLGGKMLSLCSSFCPAGLELAPRDAQQGRICRVSFTKANATELELHALASSHVFVQQEGGQAEYEGQVERWGELHGDSRDMVIVRVTHGKDGGEAVLCQVQLDVAPDSQDIQSLQDFEKLKVSNALRYEVLTEILSSLGLRCELSQVPPLSPVYLLSASQESQDTFLQWLRMQVDGEGVLRSSKLSLKAVSCAEAQAPLPEGTLALVTDPPEVLSEQFSLQTYSLHLHSRVLGRSLLFAETTSTTMDLLEGLMLRLPGEVGLIAIAARQTKGRGRGGNAWLSPSGCAMFTAHVRVEISSHLGQRIAFLQHLAALAVVEAVRTLPGYEDIDLRVKWPNDIYYSNVMKLGGVLVNSTVMGSTFHLLVGCGFNVDNSNPTICINDLVAQHNRQWGSTLELFSTSQLIARSISKLEKLIDTFQDMGPHGVLPLYYKRWVHSGTQVRLWSEDGPLADVVGLDEHGFLQVRSGEQGVVSVQPDGNSFDMLKNLVVTKQH